VRQAVLADVSAIAGIQAASFLELGVTVASEVLIEPWRSAVLGADGERTVLVAVEGEVVCGFAAVDASEILAIEVSKPYRKRGHGSRLLSALVDFTQTSVVGMWILPEQEQLVQFMRGAGFGPSGDYRKLEDETMTQHYWHAEL
jgi:Acetyltransferase (GNAT) family.